MPRLEGVYIDLHTLLMPRENAGVHCARSTESAREHTPFVRCDFAKTGVAGSDQDSPGGALSGRFKASVRLPFAVASKVIGLLQTSVRRKSAAELSSDPACDGVASISKAIGYGSHILVNWCCRCRPACGLKERHILRPTSLGLFSRLPGLNSQSPASLRLDSS